MPIFLAPLIALIIKVFTWLLAGLFSLGAGVLAFFAATASKKLALSFTYISIFVSILSISILAIKSLVSPLVAAAAGIDSNLFLGLSYVMPPIANYAISAMISARIVVWIYIQHMTMLKNSF